MEKKSETAISGLGFKGYQPPSSWMGMILNDTEDAEATAVSISHSPGGPTC